MQETLTALLILAAVAYLVWRWRKSQRAKGACSACAHASTPPVVRSSADPAR